MAGKVPIVYDEAFDFDLGGLETQHPFTNKKYSETFQYLKKQGWLKQGSWHIPEVIRKRDLLLVHTNAYLDSLSDSKTVFTAFEWDPPKGADQAHEIAKRIVFTQNLGTSGTVLAAKLAMEDPGHWAINLSGGYHHAYADRGGGFCLLADGPIAILKVLQKKPDTRVLIVDLDAHHGDGNAAFFEDHPQVFIFDIYNESAYPFPLSDDAPKRPIAFDLPISPGTSDRAYLRLLKSKLPQAIRQIQPDLIFYNAGTDIYIKDSLGGLQISAEGLIERDEFVFQKAKEAGIPIFMAMSGGYADDVFQVIGRSIENLFLKGIVSR